MRFILACLAFIAFLLALPDAAQCGMIEVRPTLLVLTPQQHIAVLSLMNPEARATVYQVRVYRWQQKDGEQILEPGDDIIASPPMISLPGHGSQIVRIGLRGDHFPADEQPYRLVLEEIPTVDIPDKPGLTIALRLSFPLFVRAQTDLPPQQLSADMRLSGGEATVTVHNNGRYTARITHAALNLPGIDKTGTTAAKDLSYILPGAWAAYHFALPDMPASFHGASVNLQTDQGSLDLETPLVAEVTPHASAPMVP